MAWPSTPLTSYVANSTPTIKAADLNAFQSGINGIINGTYSLAAAVIDATGGLVVAPPAGSLQVSGADISNTAVPSTSVPSGQMFQDTVCLGYCRAYWDGAAMVPVRVANVRSLVRNGTGDYTVIFNATMASPATAIVEITMGINPTDPNRGFIGNPLQIKDDGSSRLEVRFVTIDPVAVAKLDTNVSGNFIVTVRGS